MPSFSRLGYPSTNLPNNSFETAQIMMMLIIDLEGRKREREMIEKWEKGTLLVALFVSSTFWVLHVCKLEKTKRRRRGEGSCAPGV